MLCATQHAELPPGYGNVGSIRRSEVFDIQLNAADFRAVWWWLYAFRLTATFPSGAAAEAGCRASKTADGLRWMTVR